ncbi:MAG: hypothetical protein JNL01_14775 [Bdellovibrionales bacterium]|nr:hypothetical protein [Bdellovibrionales bacterium]
MKFWLALSLGSVFFANASSSTEADVSPKAKVVEAADREKPAEAPTAAAPTVAKESHRPQSPEACLAYEGAAEDIKKRREELDAREKELKAKETELLAKTQALEAEIRKISDIRDEISKVEAIQAKENETKVAKVVETIESMSPKAAAKMIANLDETLAVSAMNRLATPKLAKILNLMEPATASRLNEILAGVTRAKRSRDRSDQQARRSAEVTDQSMDRADRVPAAGSSTSAKGGEKNGQSINDNGNAGRSGTSRTDK